MSEMTPKPEQVRLTLAERDAIRDGLPHMACPKPGEVGACNCLDVYEAVERIIAARVAVAKVEALRNARGDVCASLHDVLGSTDKCEEVEVFLDHLADDIERRYRPENGADS